LGLERGLIGQERGIQKTEGKFGLEVPWEGLPNWRAFQGLPSYLIRAF